MNLSHASARVRIQTSRLKNDLTVVLRDLALPDVRQRPRADMTNPEWSTLMPALSCSHIRKVHP